MCCCPVCLGGRQAGRLKCTSPPSMDGVQMLYSIVLSSIDNRPLCLCIVTQQMSSLRATVACQMPLLYH